MPQSQAPSYEQLLALFTQLRRENEQLKVRDREWAAREEGFKAQSKDLLGMVEALNKRVKALEAEIASRRR